MKKIKNRGYKCVLDMDLYLKSEEILNNECL